MEKDKQRILVRLFHKAMKKWHLSIDECADIFDEYEVDSYIDHAYEFFHVQGDEANLDDIRCYLIGRGVTL